MRLRAFVTVVVLAAALAGCGDEPTATPTAPEGSPGTSPEGSPGTLTGAPLEIRDVIATSQAPAPDSLVKQQFDALDCAAPPVPVGIEEQGAACDADGTKYSLGPAVVLGGVETARAEMDTSTGLWVVTVDLDTDATDSLGAMSAELAATGGRLALLVDSVVISAPTVEAPITNGSLQLAGDFDEERATALAAQLSAG